MNRNVLYCAMALLLVFSFSSMAMAAEGGMPLATQAQQDANKTVQMSTTALSQFAASGKIPKYVFDNAKGIVIVPHLVKAGLGVGGHWGRGVLMTRDKQGKWGLPVFVSIGGASVGAQIGVELSDLLLALNDPFAIQKLLQTNNFTLGLDASVAAGPVGAKAKASTASVVSYQRNKGLFIGLDLNGGVLHVDKEPTVAYYRLNEPPAQAYFGQNETQMAQNILSANKNYKKDQQLFQNVPESAEILRATMNRISPK
jgi:lipid-binding SYLF domain-containing protein